MGSPKVTAPAPPPPPPAPPNPGAADVSAVNAQAQAAARAYGGLSSTILTGPSGAAQNAQGKALTGQ